MYVTVSFEKSLFGFSYFISEFMKKRLAPLRIRINHRNEDEYRNGRLATSTGISVVLVIVVPFCKRLVIVNSY